MLEIGAGPGRFTIELARLGAHVTVGDLSPTQLCLNAAFVAEAGCEHVVEARLQLDAVDLSRFTDGSFDAVVCYGGVLSYLFDHAGDALGERLDPGVVKDRKLLGPAIESAMRCSKCAAGAWRDVEEFAEILADAVQEAICSVSV